LVGPDSPIRKRIGPNTLDGGPPLLVTRASTSAKRCSPATTNRGWPGRHRHRPPARTPHCGQSGECRPAATSRSALESPRRGLFARLRALARLRPGRLPAAATKAERPPGPRSMGTATATLNFLAERHWPSNSGMVVKLFA
jgi:hypothetical protein